MTDRFSPSLPSNGTVKVSLVRRVAGAALKLTRAWIEAVASPALVLWPFEFRVARERIDGSCGLKPIA